MRNALSYHFFFFNDPATTEIYTLSLHDALPIFVHERRHDKADDPRTDTGRPHVHGRPCGPEGVVLRENAGRRSEEHTSELQSRRDLVCRLLLEKKKKKKQQCICTQMLDLSSHSA